MDEKEKIRRLEENAKKLCPDIMSRKSPSVYFQLAKDFLMKAAKSKSVNDYDTCFVNLRAYMLLIERIRKHKDISQFQKELDYNRGKLTNITDELNALRRLMFPQQVLGIQLSKKPVLKDAPEVKVEEKMSPRMQRIEEEKKNLILIQREEQVIKKMPDGESLLENQFYNLEDCVLEL